MAGRQYIRDTTKEMGMKKKEQLRKRVLEKQTKEATKRSKISIQEMDADNSQGTAISHSRLRALVTGDKEILKTLYTKNELMTLFHAYNLKFVQSANKDRLNAELSERIPGVESMPNCGAFALAQKKNSLYVDGNV